MTFSLDTNVVVRLFIDDNLKQTALAESCLERYEQIAIADLAIVETVYILSDYYQKGREVASKCVSSLLAHPKINCNRALFTKALRLYEEHPALSIEDCSLVVYAELTNAAPLLTFDKKLANQTQHSTLLGA